MQAHVLSDVGLHIIAASACRWWPPHIPASSWGASRKRCVSKDGRSHAFSHPSRRGQEAAPPAITAKPLRRD